MKSVESEAEAEAEVEAEANEGTVAAAVALSAAGGVLSPGSKVSTLLSGSISKSVLKPGPKDDPTAITNSGSNGKNGARDAIVKGSGDAEAEAEVESEAEVEVANGAAVAAGGSSVVAGGGARSVFLSSDGKFLLSPNEVSVTVDAKTSTSTSTSKVEIEFPTGEATGTNDDNTNAEATPVESTEQGSGFGLEYADANDELLIQTNTETETEAEAEAEAEAETTSGAAAAAATGGVAVVSAGDYGRTSGRVSVASGTSTSKVKEPLPPVYQDNEDGTGETLVDPNAKFGFETKDLGADECKGLSEAEAESESEVEAEAETDNNAAAASAVATAAGGSNGIGATAQSAAATSVSTSTEKNNGALVRDNDVKEGATGITPDDGGGADEAEASASADAEAETGTETSNGSASASAEGDATASSELVLDGEAVTVKKSLGENLATDDGRKENIGKAVAENVAPVGSLESENEVEAEAEAEAEIGFFSAAAAAGASAAQAQNSIISLPSETAASSATSTSVSDNDPNHQSEESTPGPDLDGNYGGLPDVAYDINTLALEIEAEAEAEAEVGYEAAAAAASAAAAGFPGILAQTDIAINRYGAAAASGSGEVVTLAVSVPVEGQAGPVTATARATDSQGRPVAVAVAVAGVPFEDGQDNEAEEELEADGVAEVSVSVMTDPADALNPKQLSFGSDDETEVEGENPPKVTDGSFLVLGEVESEAEAEAEAEVGYGVAAAAASAASGGLGATTSSKALTATDKYKGTYDFSSSSRIQNLQGKAFDEGVSLYWQGLGAEEYIVERRVGDRFEVVGTAPGSKEEVARDFRFTVRQHNADLTGEYRIRDRDNESVFQFVEINDAPRPAVVPSPNPFYERMRHNLSVESDQHVKVTVFDMGGREIATLFDANMTAHSINPLVWEPEVTVPTGWYVLRVTGKDIDQVHRVHYLAR